MPQDNAASYDAIVIGAGISGLICACYLARAGLRVVVLEQHDKPGGYFTSFRRKEFLFDAAAHSFGNFREDGHVRKILTELGVTDQLEITRHNPSDIVVTPDFTVTFHNDSQTTITELARKFPKEKVNIASFFNFLTTARQTEFVKLKDKSFEYLLRSFFNDKKLMSALAFPVFGNGGLPPSLMHAFSGAKIFSEFLIDGGYYPSGGIQNLPNTLALIIAKKGGEFKYRNMVKRIMSDGNTVRGVELENGAHLFADRVVAACDLVKTYNSLLGEHVVGAERLTRLSKMVPSVSTFILYIGLAPEYNAGSHPGTNIWSLGSYDLDHIYSNIKKCIFNDPAAFMYRLSPDRKTLLAFMSAPFASPFFWKQNKKEIAGFFLEKLENLVPDLKNNIAYFDSASPATLQRYSLNHEGSAFGWAKMPSQTFDIVSSKISPLKNLYFAGHWTSLGFGMPGACYSGYETARRIIRKA